MVKFLASLCLLLSLFLVVPRQARANYLDTVGQDQTTLYKQALESSGMNLPQFSLTSIDYFIMGLTKKLVGYPLLEGETQNTSVQSSLGGVIASLYSGQPSTVEYIAYSANKLNLIKPTYAATTGREFISPILNIWTIARNTAYVFFIVIFVLFGFMIMFRSKLNPQTVIGIQLALPRIVVALIMVTFSYAISGLIIDTVFFGHSLLKNIMTEPGSFCPSGSQNIEGFVFDNPKVKWEEDCNNGVNTPSAWPFDILNKYGGDGVIQQMLEGVGAALLGTGAALVFGQDWAVAIEGLFKLIIAFSVVGATFKIFFNLLTKYIMIILLVITMPFSFLASALSAEASPLKPLKSLLANTLAFPITSALLALAYYFSNANTPGFDSLPPFYSNEFQASTSGAGTAGRVTGSLIAIGILMAIPSILSAIDQALESKPVAQGAAEQLSATARKIPIIGGMMG